MRGCRCAREEVRRFVGALIVARTDWTLEWSPHVTATDASLHGFGICTANWPRSAVAQAGRVPERSRFKAVMPGEKGAVLHSAELKLKKKTKQKTDAREIVGAADAKKAKNGLSKDGPDPLGGKGGQKHKGKASPRIS